MRNSKKIVLQIIFPILVLALAPTAQASELNLPSDLKIAGLTLDFPFARVNKPSSYELLVNFQIEPKGVMAADANDLSTFKEVAPTPLSTIQPTPTVAPKVAVKEEVKKTVLAQEIKAAPTLKPVATVDPTPVPTEKPKGEEVKQVEPQGNPVGGLDPEKLFRMSNEYRTSKGLAAFEKDERACKLASERAPEIAAEIAGGYMHKGMRDRKLPYFNSENIITMRTEEAAFNWWINDYIHRVQIEGDYKFSCVACYGSACVQEFTNFTPKG